MYFIAEMRSNKCEGADVVKIPVSSSGTAQSIYDSLQAMGMALIRLLPVESVKEFGKLSGTDQSSEIKRLQGSEGHS